MAKSDKSLFFMFRTWRWLLAAALLGLLLACGGGGGDATNVDVQAKQDPPACVSVPSAPTTEACTGGQLGTHTFKTETASCSANKGKIIEDDTSACLPNTASNRIMLAMKEGDSSVLLGSDASVLAEQAYTSYQSSITSQNNLIAAFYQGLSTKFDLVRDSYMVQSSVANIEKVFPLVVGDKGNVLASISTIGDGRIVGYGYDILAGFVPNQTRVIGWNGTSEVAARQTNHQPVFKRVLAWLITGDVSSDLASQSAAKLNIAWASLPTSSTVMYTTSGGQKVYKPYAADGLAALNISFTNLQCDPLSAPVTDCAAKAQLVVIGAYDRRLSSDSAKVKTQLDRIKEIVAAKIPVLYVNAHPDGGNPNDYARATWPEDFPRLDALGFGSGDTPDRRNYFILDYVGADLTPTQLKARNDPLSGDLLFKIFSGPFKDATIYNWSNCVVDSDCVVPQGFTDDIVTPLKKIADLVDRINTNRQNLFDPQVRNQTLQKLILWADAYRKTIVYPINKLTDPEKFQKAYIADALVAYVRKYGSAQTDLGSLLPAEANSVVGSATTENLRVTLSGTEGNTAIGRFALPGQAITFRFSKVPSAGSFKLYINTATSTTTKLFSSGFDSAGKPNLGSGYRRPRLPQSAKFSISTEPLTIVSPYGGTLQLSFSGAADPAVEIQIQGTAKHPFYDTTQGTPDESAFLQDIQTSKLGWFEIKTPYIELHSLISKFTIALLPASTAPASTVYPNPSKPYFNTATKSIDLKKYVAEAEKYITVDGYQLFGLPPAGMELNSHILGVCTRLGWDCTSSTVHKKRATQHFHVDYVAACGAMCSTDPITTGENVNPRGWGESHELGHLLVRFKVYDWKTSEVANNIYPLHKRWRMLVDLKRDAVGYSNELDGQQLIFEALKNAYHAPGSRSQFWAAEDAVWNLSKMPEGALLSFYTQWPLLYADILRKQDPNISELDAIEAGWSIYPLMNLHLRQTNASTNWLADRNKLGFSTYAQKPSTGHAEKSPDRGVYYHHDYLLVALSLITGYDQRAMFKFWGISTNQAAQDQVAALRDVNGQALPEQALNFYATRCSDDFRGFQVIDMTKTSAAFPWANEFKVAADTSAVITTKQNLHQTACMATGR